MNCVNQYDIYLVRTPTGGGPGAMAPWTPPKSGSVPADETDIGATPS